MTQPLWISESRKILACVDSYDEGVPKGRIYYLNQDGEQFASLSQLLIRVEELLNEPKMPQSYTTVRTFSSLLQPDDSGEPATRFRKGKKATFELQILFRQHTSWQGVVIWREGSAEQSFRSVLELVVLMDSALRSLERDDGV